MMGIASRRLHRAVAWMGLVAILLLALVPTASRIASACAPVDHGGHAAHAHHHADVDAHESTLPGEDCWSKCAYCDFLALLLGVLGVQTVIMIIMAVYFAASGTPANELSDALLNSIRIPAVFVDDAGDRDSADDAAVLTHHAPLPSAPGSFASGLATLTSISATS